MLIRKAYKFRLDTTAEQRARLAVMCGHSRFIYNHGLRHCLEELDKGNYIPSYQNICSSLTQWKKEPELYWLKEAYTTNFQQKLKDLRNAWTRYFDPSLEAEKPCFKKKSKKKDSIRFVDFHKYCKLDGGRVKLPAKLGWVKFRKSQEIQGTIKNCTVSANAGHWYISFQVEQIIDKPVHASETAVGIDMGITRFVTLSDHTYLKPLNSFRTHEKKLAKAQRELSRKVKFSSNWRKQKQKIQRLHSTIANCRKDFLHKSSSEISKNHAMISIEDLRIKNMSASAKGTEEEPGTNVKQKSGLNKSILDQGWGEFRRQLEYKALWQGGEVVAVPPHYTSQTCPKKTCGHVSKDNRETQARFECKKCGYTNNADVVGALNVLERGHPLFSLWRGAVTPSMKQEPVV